MSPSAAARPHIAYLDGLRAIACLLVAFNHFPYGLEVPYMAFYSTREYFGVDIFAVLSGFVVFYTYNYKVYETGDRFNSKIAFIFSRLKRIYSLVLPALSIACVDNMLTQNLSLGTASWQAITTLGFMGSKYIGAPYWSLINEVIFYLISPFLLYPLINGSKWRWTRGLVLVVPGLFLFWY
jgi:peptidoglycan/LPS O-acetylase OafA/YrhL